jgi:putative glycosyltransferase (TIGR04372 family)
LQLAAMIETARAHREAGRVADAEALLVQVLNASPQNGRAHHQLGLTFVAAGRLPEAAARLAHAVALAPTNPDRHADLAEVANVAGDRAAAQRHLRCAVVLGPVREDVLLRLGRLSLAWDRASDAETWLRRAIALRRPYAEAQVVLGYARYRAGRMDEAIRTFSEVTEESPGYILAFEALAAVLQETGAPKRDVMKAALVVARHRPDDRTNVPQVMQYLRDIGEEDEAQRFATRIIDRQMAAAAEDEIGRLGTRILYPDACVARIGEMAFQLDLYVKMRALGWIPPFTTILAPQPNEVVNRCLLDYWRSYITVVDDPAEVARLSPLKLRIAFDLNYLRLPNGTAVSKNRAIFPIQEEWQRQGRGPLLSLTEAHADRGRAVLRQMGIPEGAWFVCVHVRETGYLKGTDVTEATRNADIRSYFPAMGEITRRGGWVVRLGDSSMLPMPPMPQVVDYARSSFKSEEMDVFLAASARFCVGTSSGMLNVASVFGVPIATANFFPFGESAHTARDVLVPKLCRELSTGRVLSFEECLAMPLALTYDAVHFQSLGLETIDNDAEDVRDLTLEMLARADGEWPYTDDDEALQKRWKDLCRPHSTGDVGCRVGRGFLRRHRNLFRSA